MMYFFQDEGQKSSGLSPVGYAMTAPEMELEDPIPWTGEDLLEMAKFLDQETDEMQSEAV